jgi:hypothetical protein
MKKSKKQSKSIADNLPITLEVVVKAFIKRDDGGGIWFCKDPNLIQMTTGFFVGIFQVDE